MQKFTIFTIIFSAVVIVTVSELVVHDYIDRHSDEGSAIAEVDGSDIQASVIDLPAEEPANTSILAGLDYQLFGFTDGSYLKEKNFPDNVFQFLEFDFDNTDGMYWEMFDGKSYEGGLYEIICENPTDAFTVYTDLKSSALDQPDNGTMNEVNNYGLASFYFNDNVKTDTVFLVILSEDRVYALTYQKAMHDVFKEVADSL